jgi:hypothetical protein
MTGLVLEVKAIGSNGGFKAGAMLCGKVKQINAG